jgi:hypothetical protein
MKSPPPSSKGSYTSDAPSSSSDRFWDRFYYNAGGTGAYKEGNPTAGYYENGVAKMAYKRIFIRHRKPAKKGKK